MGWMFLVLIALSTAGLAYLAWTDPKRRCSDLLSQISIHRTQYELF